MRRPDVEGKVGSGVGVEDRALYLEVQHITAADTAAGAPPAVTILVSNDQVRCTYGTERFGSGVAEQPH
jgi:hypothetical protein